MKMDRLVGDRFKERPSDCVIDSHALMLRGGYMKYVTNGIFSQYMPLRRITKKIEDIIRQEMDRIDGQEVLFPVVMPASLWEESGRYQSVGTELVRLQDRNKAPLHWGWVAFVGLVAGLLLLYGALMASHVAAFRILYGLRIRLSGHILLRYSLGDIPV